MKILYGYAGKILRIDLSKGKIAREPLDRELIDGFIGGLGASAKILYDLLPARVESLSPDNVVIFATGPVQGTLIPGAGRGLFVSKSPLTGRFFNSNFGGFLSAELKKAGYDLIVLVGAADKPVYISVDDDNVEIRDAGNIWGMTTYEAQKAIREELGDNRVQIACIGPAGEKLVRYSAIIHDIHAAGRGGIASVLGVKRVKAIAIRGSGDIEVPDANALIEFYKEIADKCREHVFRTYGTTTVPSLLNRIGCLGTRNWQKEVFEDADKIDGHATIPKYLIAEAACYGCPMGCVKIQRADKDEVYAKGPEYETLYSLGSLLEINDFSAIVRAARLCDEMGVDTISAGVTVAYAIECYEKGILTKEDTGGLELKFGDGDILYELLEKICRREGWLGNLLAEGVMRASDVIGSGSKFFAMHFKGLELAGHSPRGVKGWTLGYSVGWRGGSHHDGRVHDIEYPRPVEERAFSIEDKPEILYDTVHRVMIEESLIVCRFFGGYYGAREPSQTHVEILKLATGRQLTLEELWKIARRIRTLIRCLEVRDGFSRRDDVNAPPYRVLYEPIPDGPSKGAYTKPSEFRLMLDRFYELMGWDQLTGKPKPETLRELDLDYASKDLYG